MPNPVISGPPLPTYVCHKRVLAGLILRDKQSEEAPFDHVLTLQSPRGEHGVVVTHEWVKRYAPKIGGYFVCYEDGYCSYSPAGVFEAGYRLLTVADLPSPTAEGVNRWYEDPDALARAEGRTFKHPPEGSR